MTASLIGCTRKHGDWPQDVRVRSATGATDLVRAAKGSPVLLVLFAGWCDDCRREMPEVARTVRLHRGSELQTVAVTLDEDPAAYRRIAADADLGVDPVRLEPLDDDELVAAVRSLGGHYHHSIPYVAVFDASGTLVRDRWAEGRRAEDISQTVANVLEAK